MDGLSVALSIPEEFRGIVHDSLTGAARDAAASLVSALVLGVAEAAPECVIDLFWDPSRGSAPGPDRWLGQAEESALTADAAAEALVSRLESSWVAPNWLPHQQELSAILLWVAPGRGPRTDLAEPEPIDLDAGRLGEMARVTGALLTLGLRGGYQQGELDLECEVGGPPERLVRAREQLQRRLEACVPGGVEVRD